MIKFASIFLLVLALLGCGADQHLGRTRLNYSNGPKTLEWDNNKNIDLEYHPEQGFSIRSVTPEAAIAYSAMNSMKWAEITQQFLKDIVPLLKQAAPIPGVSTFRKSINPMNPMDLRQYNKPPSIINPEDLLDVPSLPEPIISVPVPVHPDNANKPFSVEAKPDSKPEVLKYRILDCGLWPKHCQEGKYIPTGRQYNCDGEKCVPRQ